MEDLYGSKDDDIDDDTRYIAQSLMASPIAEFYGLDASSVIILISFCWEYGVLIMFFP